MGEQSTKTLRGAKMEDVIFGGTAEARAGGLCGGDARPGQHRPGASRWTPTRSWSPAAYYRSGESEYYINKQSARLRDINELFMDTGLGREGYSNIGQGRIDEILAVKSDRPPGDL